MQILRASVLSFYSLDYTNLTEQISMPFVRKNNMIIKIIIILITDIIMDIIICNWIQQSTSKSWNLGILDCTQYV